jgi:hypothetical protein
MPPDAVLLFEDETVLRLFPVLRRAWTLCGELGKVAISEPVLKVCLKLVDLA